MRFFPSRVEVAVGIRSSRILGAGRLSEAVDVTAGQNANGGRPNPGPLHVQPNRPVATNACEVKAPFGIGCGGLDHSPRGGIERRKPVVNVDLVAAQEIRVADFDRGTHSVPTWIGEFEDGVDGDGGPDYGHAAGVDDLTGDCKIGREMKVVGVLVLHLPHTTAVDGWQLHPGRTKALGQSNQRRLTLREQISAARDAPQGLLWHGETVGAIGVGCT